MYRAITNDFSSRIGAAVWQISRERPPTTTIATECHSEYPKRVRVKRRSAGLEISRTVQIIGADRLGFDALLNIISRVGNPVWAVTYLANWTGHQVPRDIPRP